MIELKRCPFCGDIAVIQEDISEDRTATIYRVECTECFASTDDYIYVDRAIEMWNTRISERDAALNYHREQQAKSRSEHRKKYNEYHRNYYTQNRERISARRKARRDAKKEGK